MSKTPYQCLQIAGVPNAPLGGPTGAKDSSMITQVPSVHAEINCAR